MAEARIQITADTSQLNSGIKSAINDLDQLKAKQDELNANTNKNLNNTSKAYGKANKGLQQQNKLTKESLGGLKTTEASISKLGTAADASGKKVGKFGKIGGIFKQIGQSAKAFLLSPVGLIITAITALGAAFTKSIKVQREFQKSLAELQAITGATNEELDFYRETAKEIAADRTLSTNINETVNAFKLVGSAKPELLAVKEDLAAVTKEAILLSKASGDTLESSVKSLTDTLNQYNLDASKAAEVTNILAAGSKFGAAAVPQITEAIVKFGVAANASNISVAESVGAIETLAEKGLQGAEAGTQLRNVFNKLSATDILPKQAIDRLVQAGVDVEGLSDKTLSLEERFKLLAPIQDDANALTAVFGAESKNAAQILIQNTDALANYTDAVQTQGIAQEQANINSNTFDAALARLGNSFDALLAGSGDLVEFLTPFVNKIAEFVEWIVNFKDSIETLDFAGIGASMLELFDTLTYGIFGLDEYSTKLRLISDVTKQVVSQVEGQATGLAELTTLLGRNNDALTEGNLTQEETNKIQSENEAIIKQLREQYPELTSMVDLQTASSRELKQATKELTEQFVASAIEEAKAQKQKELINQLIQNQIDLSRAEAEGNTGVLGFFSEVNDLKEAGKDIEKQLKSINEDFADAEANINGLGIDFAAGINAELAALDDAQERLENFTTQLEILRDGTDQYITTITGQKVKVEDLLPSEEALEAKIESQNAIILEQEKKKNAIIFKEKIGASIAEGVAQAEEQKKQAAAASKKAIEEAKKLADARKEQLLKAAEEEAKLLQELFDRRLDAEADTEEERILLNQQRAIEELAGLEDKLKEQVALQKVAAELGMDFVLKASEEELQAQVDKYKQQAILTEEQEQVIADLKKNIVTTTQQELLQLQLENEIELLSIQESSAATRLQILAQQEKNAIREVTEDELLTEEQKQIRILDIQSTAGDAKIRIINEEFDAKKEQIEKEIELLEAQGDEISLLQAEQLQETITLNELERQSTIQGVNDEVQAAKDAAAELENISLQAQVDNIIGKLFGTDDPNEIQAVKDAFKNIVDNVVEIYKQGIQQQLEEQQKVIDGLDEQIAKQEEVVGRQQELQADGNANSLNLERERLAELEAQRQEALAKQEELEQKQQRIDTLTQASSLITASANIFKSLSGLGPAGLILAVGAVASMLAAFVKTKADINKATQKFEKGGVIKGKRHSQGGEMLLDHVEVEQGEQVSVLSRRATSRYGLLMEQITNSFNAGKMPVLPNQEVISNIKKVESRNFEAKFDNAVNKRAEQLLNKNNEKLDELIAAVKGQPNRYATEKRTTEKKGSTIKHKRK